MHNVLLIKKKTNLEDKCILHKNSIHKNYLVSREMFYE